MCILKSPVFQVFFFINYIYCEEFNLYGEAGQAYALVINIGHPPQKLHVLVDTGSATLAIAAYARKDSNIYFHKENSTSLYNSGKEVQAKYSQGTWSGTLASDFIHFPSLPTVPEVRSDLALITKSYKFFMNGSGWQGLLGLAYLPVAAWGDSVVVGSWLDFVEKVNARPLSFELKLCGSTSPVNATHYGNLRMFDDRNASEAGEYMFRTPILRKRWYEIGVLAIRVSNSGADRERAANGTRDRNDIDLEECRLINAEKSIVDSGTTGIRMPDAVFRRVVGELRSSARTSSTLVLDEFWYHGEAACWPEPQEWNLPSLAVDILSSEADDRYFTLEIPAQSFMRVISARNKSASSGSVSEFCYKLGLEAAPGTVLGYTAMEGLQVLFNRSGGWIGWRESSCGPAARTSGPSNASGSLLSACGLDRSLPDVNVSIKAAQWTLCAISVVAVAVLVYLLAPCLKMLPVRRSPRCQQISLSQAALVERDA
ncbi:beta-secretase 1-like [Pieris brassicae]|uniref:beta-secretase 1-like n=1 Tax=Pieris brassicae TaxID=7116 RepID=UPI001E65E33A|nr:beta-secretase 1-like [Pieris brassicae]